MEHGAERGHRGGSWGKATAHGSSSKAKSHLLWPQDFLSFYTLSPEEQPKLFHSLLINPGLSASGKVTLFIKMPLWAPKKKKKSCSTMVICIQRKKKSGVHYPVTKKLEALTPPATDSFLNIHFFCISIPASNPPSGRKKASSTQHTFCWQECFKTVVSDKTKTSIWTFEKPAHSYSPRGYGAIVCLSLILPLWTWHANITLHTITFLSLMRRHKYCRRGTPSRPGHGWQHLPQFFLVCIPSSTPWAYRGEFWRRTHRGWSPTTDNLAFSSGVHLIWKGWEKSRTRAGDGAGRRRAVTSLAPNNPRLLLRNQAGGKETKKKIWHLPKTNNKSLLGMSS